MPAAAPLPENLPFAFRGEALDPARLLPVAALRRLRTARNPTGKPNADVLRDFTGVAADGTELRRTAVDFPAEISPAETLLYQEPAAWLARRGAPAASPHADPALRAALARLERFLAAPADASAGFDWIEGDVLPDDSLVVWARDDDAGAAVLASSAFGLWLETAPDLLAALRSFPFPWPPATPLGALSREQEENYFALARAARTGDGSAIDAAALAAYGLPASLEADELLAHLRGLHHSRSGGRP